MDKFATKVAGSSDADMTGLPAASDNYFLEGI
jgi:hypothetical protein